MFVLAVLNYSKASLQKLLVKLNSARNTVITVIKLKPITLGDMPQNSKHEAFLSATMLRYITEIVQKSVYLDRQDIFPRSYKKYDIYNFKHQLGCTFDILDSISSFFFCILTYATIYGLIHHIIFGFIFTS